jgi:lipopolysaccharide biosynthesis glycosyltransferase
MPATVREKMAEEYKHLHVVYALDDNFSVLTGVSIESLCVNNAQEFDAVSIHILDTGISDENKSKLSVPGKKYSNVKIYFYSDIDISVIATYPVSGVWTSATYLRLVMSMILPDSIERCLYLDGDTVICGSLREMYSADMGDKIIAGVLYDETRDDLHYYPYINTGVLLLDLKKWRSENITDKLLAYGNDNMERLKYVDQDIINPVIKDKLLFPPKYNNIACYYSMRKWLTKAAIDYYGKKAIVEARNDPTIIHYMGYHYFRGTFPVLRKAFREFKRYKRMSAFKDAPDYIKRKRFNGLAIVAFWLNYVSPIPFERPFRLLLRLYEHSKKGEI